MGIPMYQLGNVDACAAKRAFNFKLNGNPEAHTLKAGIIKKTIDALLNGRVTLEDAEKDIAEQFKELPYASEKQRLIHAKDALRQIKRYVSCEKRRLLKAVPQDVDLGHGLTVSCNPDYVFVDGDAIEVIKIKTSKPNLSQSGAYDDLGLYAMLCYGRLLVVPGGTAKIRASYYFLRKQNDSFSEETANFDSDFFLTTGGRNIVGVYEEYANDGNPNNTDKWYEPRVEKYVDGLPKEECSEEDCSKCELYELCHFSAAPLAITRKAVVRSVRDLELTPEQEEVIEYEKGICRVNAGAGAGKTLVVALRTATLINKGVAPNEMLLITFTNAGAEEMRSRIKLILGDFGIDTDISDMYIMTFNAFGDMILKSEYARLGFTAAPKLIDDVERSRIIADLLNEDPIEGLDYRNFDSNMKTCMGALAVARLVFGIVKAGSYSASDVDAVRSKMGQKARFATVPAVEDLIRLYDKYDDMLKTENLIEYSDQEVLIRDLLRVDPYYLERFGFKHITVDEFQDTSEGQIDLIRRITECPAFESLMVVGDDSQSIYSFRDTTPEYILHFDKYIGGKVDDITLVENHRSTPEILEAANKMNATRTDRIDKDLVATRPSGKKVEAEGFLTKQEEIDYVVKGIKEHLEAGVKPEDIAVIAATKYELISMADVLNTEGIPSVMLNPEPLLENSRVCAALALFRAIRDPHDTKDRLVYGNALYENDLMKASSEDIEKVIKDVDDQINEYYELEEEEDRKARLIEMLEAIDFNSDEVYENFLETLKTKPVVRMFEYADDFARFGTEAAYRRTHNYPGVVLTTAHSSKGLEWNVVYNMISKYDSAELHNNSSLSRNMLEERRRLLFVSMTRARDELYITGQYVTSGKRGEYLYNGLLMDAYACAGRKPFTEFGVEQLRRTREEDEKARKAAEKEAAKSAEAEAGAENRLASPMPEELLKKKEKKAKPKPKTKGDEKEVAEEAG